MTPKKHAGLRVLYIAGAGRSGSTILDRVLGTVKSAASYNELYRVFEDGFAANGRCACGMAFRDCGFWHGVAIKSDLTDREIRECIEASRQFDRSRMFPAVYLDWMGESKRKQLARYRSQLARLLRAMAAQAEIDTIVDSSKLPTRALLLDGLDGIDVSVIHLIREPRAVAHAWLKQRFDPGKESSMSRYGVQRTMLFWAGRQLLAERLARRLPYLRIRYEDFARHPEQTLDEIAGFVPGWEGRMPAIGSDGGVNLGVLHSLSGNPDRFATGHTRIRLDQAWQDSGDRQKLDRARHLIGPVARRYGY